MQQNNKKPDRHNSHHKVNLGKDLGDGYIEF